MNKLTCSRKDRFSALEVWRQCQWRNRDFPWRGVNYHRIRQWVEYSGERTAILSISALHDTMILNKLNTTNFVLLFQWSFKGLFTLYATSTDTDIGKLYSNNFNLRDSLVTVICCGEWIANALFATLGTVPFKSIANSFVTNRSGVTVGHYDTALSRCRIVSVVDVNVSNSKINFCDSCTCKNVRLWYAFCKYIKCLKKWLVTRRIALIVWIRILFSLNFCEF